MKHELEDLLEEARELEKMEGPSRDDQLLDELRDTIDVKLKLFSSYLGTQKIQPKDD